MRVTSIVTAADVGRDLDASFHGLNPHPPSPFPLPRVYEPLWVSMSRRSDRARFVCPQISFCNKALVDAVTGPLRTGGHGPLSFRKEIETLLEEGGRRLDRLLDRSCEKLIVDC